MEIIEEKASSEENNSNSSESEDSSDDTKVSSSSNNIRYRDIVSPAVDNDLTIRINVATCQGITVDKISSQVWRDAKLQIQRLLDQNVQQLEREQIAASLTDMCDRMETKNILETNIPHNVQLAIQLGAATATAIGSATDRCASGSVDSFNDRLRERISEFNHGLISLADGISRLKNKLLALEYSTCASSRAADSVDVDVCKSIHKNFRRILQKESRFLRDELFAAKETIYRLERRGTSVSPPAERADQQRSQLVPYHHEYATPFHPATYFNLEHVPHLWQHNAVPPFMAYPAMWERMYAHPELNRQLHCYDNGCDPSIQCLPPQPISTDSNAVAIQQPSPAWTPIERSIRTDDRHKSPEKSAVEPKK